MEVLDRYFIPKKIRVGYQERSGTYTGRLGYVIYYDHKNKIRKETSWKNWCKIKDETTNELLQHEFDNIPTEGFVLNKKVGGYKSDWNYRQAYTRIYDPRGFEFEITVENLLWILDWCACSPGKGLEGKFVYGWSLDQLILIPVNTECYNICQEYSTRMYNENNKSRDQLVPGSMYRTTQGDMVYVGFLKVAKNMGAGFSSKYMFVRYECDYDNVKTLDLNHFEALEKSMITFKISDNTIDQETIDDLIYRFSITPHAYDFWHNTNLIDKFVSSNGKYRPRYKEAFCRGGQEYWRADYHGNYRDPDYSFNEIVGEISNDGKSVILHKPLVVNEIKISTNRYSNSSYATYKTKAYKFASLTSDMVITPIADCGEYTDPKISYFDRDNLHVYEYDKVYLNKNKTPYDKLEFVTEGSPIFYVTKDGYIYHLDRFLINDVFSTIKQNHCYCGGIELAHEKYNNN